MHLSNTALIEKYCTMYDCVPPSTYKSLPSLLPVATLSSLKTSTGFASFSSLKPFSPHDYVSRAGALGYLVRRSRPDLAAVAGYLQRRQNCFTLEDCIHLQRAFLYLFMTRHSGLTITGNSDLTLSVYVDANWGGREGDDRRSITGVAIYLGDTLVGWTSGRQDSVSLSTCILF